MMPQNSKKKQTHYKNDNVLEALTSVPSSVGSTVVSEVSSIGADIFTSLIGGSAPKSGELTPGQAIEFGPTPQEQPKVEPVVRVETMPRPDVDAIEAETRQQIEAIRTELKALAASLKNLHQEIQTAVSQEVVDPGVYHLNFFEQLRSMIHILQQQIEDSQTWLASFSSRKKKLGYWGMFKKHGTTFGLSNERSLATAAG